ncbi:MAG: hypothetical protein GC136_01535 [Alphaproteobacteria bacterium]|nr:hypothetical protein [Alphaproteobacteria bacterium]
MYRSLLLTLFLLVLTAPSFAEEEKTDVNYCEHIREIIITLPRPTYIPADYMWQTTPGVFGADQFSSFLGERDGLLYFLGDSTPYNTFAQPQTPQTYLAALKKKGGDEAWEQRQTHKNVMPAIMGVMHDKTIYSLHPTPANGWAIRTSEITKGNFLKETPILTDVKNFTATDMANVQNDLILAGHVDLKGRTEARLYRISADGKKLWERKFLPGIASRLEKIILLQDGTIGLVGEIAQGNTKAGWYIRVNKNGNMLTQTRFPRGTSATLTGGKADKNALWLYGDIATGEDQRGVWLARTTVDGRVLWERFITSKTPYNGAGLVVLPDSRAQLLLNSFNEKVERNVRPHARLLAFTKEGFQQTDEVFRDSSGSQAAELALLEDKTRLITGFTQTGFANLRAKGSELAGTYDAWVLLLKPEGFFRDVCPPWP